ncbi:MAG: hypothetical protein HYT80_07725 [Euryarchaeota archaeon]|nr:hypothetical protein [Euryarchaeota archaeon]
MSLDLKHMVKVYNYVNDEKRHRFNYKFLGLFLGLVVAAGALVAFAVVNAGPRAAPNDAAASQNRTDYVGLSPAEVASGAVSAASVQERLDSWYASHPDADVKGVEPVYERGVLVGYLITYAMQS